MTTGESAEESPTEDTITRLRFRLDAMCERVKRIWAAMHEADRGPGDYPPWVDERRILIDIIRKQTSSAGGGDYNEAPKEPHTKAVILGCTITLLSAFVIGAWKLSNDQAAFVAQVTEWQKSIERRIDALERRP